MMCLRWWYDRRIIRHDRCSSFELFRGSSGSLVLKLGTFFKWREQTQKDQQPWTQLLRTVLAGYLPQSLLRKNGATLAADHAFHGFVSLVCVFLCMSLVLFFVLMCLVVCVCVCVCPYVPCVFFMPLCLMLVCVVLSMPLVFFPLCPLRVCVLCFVVPALCVVVFCPCVPCLYLCPLSFFYVSCVCSYVLAFCFVFCVFKSHVSLVLLSPLSLVFLFYVFVSLSVCCVLCFFFMSRCHHCSIKFWYVYSGISKTALPRQSTSLIYNPETKQKNWHWYTKTGKRKRMK